MPTLQFGDNEVSWMLVFFLIWEQIDQVARTAHPRPLHPTRCRSLAAESLCQSSVPTDLYGVVVSDVLRQV